ncbi:S-protein homolog 2-like [Abrus precatorius]|uniref:S-protein homolog n=1 Tax=Abrus precatorius TaxID=3816 RepID=A0A8B8KHA0_ABRPR|nr:S-protein homolog 2-like [Abrus precatorius]
MGLVYRNLANMLKALGTISVLLMIIAADTLIVPVHAKKHVRVINGLGNDTFLYLHCRSRDDDLGLHVLQYNEYQEWSFNNNIRGSTLFWCSMQWNNQQHSIEVYSTKNDDEDCELKCWRVIEPDGAYFLMETRQGQWDHRYRW